MHPIDEYYKKVKLSQKDSILEFLAVGLIAVLLIGFFLKVVFF